MSSKLRGRIFRYTLALIALGIISFLTLFILVSSGFYGHIPDKEELAEIKNSEATKILDRHGDQLGKFYVQDRANLDPNDIPELVKKTLVQIEDQRFYEHKGIDYRSLGRVFFKSILLNDASSGGGSTISQQLAKNIYPRVQHRYLYYAVNKIREMIIAQRLEEIYSKDEILALYLNTVSFGLDTYGIEAASARIFNRSAKTLTVNETAVLIGMLKATTYYHPLLNPDNSKTRRNLVLREMAKVDIVDSDLLVGLLSEPLETRPAATRKKEALYFLDQINREATHILSQLGEPYNLKTDGLTIETTLDLRLQRLSEKAVASHLKDLQQKFLEQLGEEFWVKNNRILEIETDKLSSFDPETRKEMSVFTWNGETMMNYTQLDSIKHYLQFLQAGVVASDPQTGEILSWVGGIDPIHFSYDHVVSKRQVGSTIKPLIYAAALENEISPCNYYETERVSYEVDGKTWSPGNSSTVEEERLTMATALEKSVNTVTVKVLEDVGIDTAIELMRRSGVSSSIPNVPSIALGTPSISLYEMVDAYGAFANNGIRNPIHTIKSIVDKNGTVIYQRDAGMEERVFSDRTAQLMTNFMQEVTNSGTGSELRSKYKVFNDVGGKTGTSQNNADGWFIGISPKLVVGVWVGGEYPAISFKTSTYGQGARMALPIYAALYQQINQDQRFTQIANARFSPLDSGLTDELNCDPFREEFRLWTWLRAFAERKGNVQGTDSIATKPKLIDRVKSLFSRKKKD